MNDFPSERQALAKSGLSLSYEIYNINHGAELAQSQNQNLTASQIANVTTGIILQDTITIVYNTLKTVRVICLSEGCVLTLHWVSLAGEHTRVSE